MYLSFSSDELDQNQITDYLTRVVQPKLSAVSGVQRADILGDRTFAMRIWLKPDQMAALGISPSDAARGAGAQQLPLRARDAPRARWCRSTWSPTPTCGRPEEFRQLVVKEEDGVDRPAGRDRRRRRSARRTTTQDVRFNGETATFMGVWVLPTANSLDVIQAVREAIPEIEAQLPAGMKVGIPYDSTEVHPGRASTRCCTTLAETLLIVIVVIFLFLGSVRSVIIPVVAIPISLVGAVFLMLAAGFTHQPADAARHRALGRPGRGRRDRDGGERRAAPARAASRRSERPSMRARELVGPIIAMTITLAAVYAPVGIQGGLTGALFREFAFTLAGAVIVSGVVALTLSPMMGAKLLRAGDTERGFAGLDQPAVRQRARSVYIAHARRARCATARWSSRSGRIVVLLMVPFYMFSQQELAPAEDQGVVFGDRPGVAPNSTIDQTKLFTEQVHDVYRVVPGDREHLPDHVPDRRLRRHGDEAVERAHARPREQLLMEVAGPLSQIPGIRVIPLTPPPLPGGGDFPVDLVIASTAEPQRARWISPTSSCRRRSRAGCSCSPTPI